MTKVTIKNKEGTVLKTLDLDPTQKMLKQLEAAGVEIPNACLMGMCSACMCNIESGAEHVIKDFK
jgi:ferredoxin